MARVLLLQLLLIALPFVVYFIAARLVRGRVGSRPWFALLASGLTLAICAVVVLAVGFEGEGDSGYSAASWEDGRIVPGHFDE